VVNPKSIELIKYDGKERGGQEKEGRRKEGSRGKSRRRGEKVKE
jgi:hypothetical protein